MNIKQKTIYASLYLVGGLFGVFAVSLAHNLPAGAVQATDCTQGKVWSEQEKKCIEKTTSGGGGYESVSGEVDTKCGSGYKTSIIPCPKGEGETAITSILIMAINILAVGVGIAAVGGVVYAAILYSSAEDKAAQVTKAKTIIFNVMLGVIAYFLMYAFLQFIIPGGVFNG